jgi:hypothetical protein
MRPIVLALLLLLPWLPSGVPGRDGAVQAAATQAAGAPAASASALDQLLAPVALYPDALLSEMLLCSTNPGMVGALGEWLQSNAGQTGTARQDAAKAAGFEPSFVALVPFPDVVAYMARETAWTTRLGQAFTTDRSGVFASIQRLRKKARDAGTLKSTPQQDVESRTTSGGEQVIVIEPANPQVVYVPQYNPQVVYTQPSSTVVVQESSSSGAAAAAGVIGFAAGIAIGAAIDNDYYYGPYGMHGGGFYMYNDAWDDYYDHREDAREDWQDHREDLVEDRGERREDVADERGDRAASTQGQRSTQQAARQESASQRRTEATGTARGTSTAAATASGTSQQARGYSRDGSTAARERSGTTSDAFSGYSSGRSERAASERGSRSRSSSRGSGGGRRR